MRNDHQVRYLRAEAARDRVVVVDGDLSDWPTWSSAIRKLERDC